MCVGPTWFSLSFDFVALGSTWVSELRSALATCARVWSARALQRRGPGELHYPESLRRAPAALSQWGPLQRDAWARPGGTSGAPAAAVLLVTLGSVHLDRV